MAISIAQLLRIKRGGRVLIAGDLVVDDGWHVVACLDLAINRDEPRVSGCVGVVVAEQPHLVDLTHVEAVGRQDLQNRKAAYSQR